jgi:hypothetical protein
MKPNIRSLAIKIAVFKPRILDLVLISPFHFRENGFDFLLNLSRIPQAVGGERERVSEGI